MSKFRKKMLIKHDLNQKKTLYIVVNLHNLKRKKPK